ncbi:hypothetical protein [Variovorax sp.]|uniref:hypothetical protein n=1 Tax=Variovorax sp. TaxID=1871043 RepID=UPI003BAAF14F
MKTCSKCHEVKPLDEFHAHPKKAEGRDHRCKPCTKEERAALRQQNLALFRARELQPYHDRRA